MTPCDWVTRVKAKLSAHRSFMDGAAPACTPIDPATLEAIEAKWKLRLPAEYRDYVLRIENGGLGPDYGIAPLDEHGGMPRPPKRKGKNVKAAPPPDPNRPFLLTERFDVLDAKRKRRPFPVPQGTNPYDGCVMLADHGCGYFTFLVVNGPKAGEVWCDYTAAMEDAYVSPLGVSFLAWYEEWLDGALVADMGKIVQSALAGEEPSDEARAFVAEYESLLVADGEPIAAAARIDVDIFLGRNEAAAALLREAERTHPKHSALAVSRRRIHREAFAEAEGTDVSTLARVAKHAVADVREAVAKNTNASDAVLALLADDPIDEVRQAVARHPSAGQATLEALFRPAFAQWRSLADEARLYELEAIARHAHAPVAIATAILDDNRETSLRPWLVRAAAMHAALEDGRVQALARSPQAIVRHAIATRPMLDDDLIARLARDPDHTVRLTIAARPSLADDILDRLSRDDSEIVRSMIARHPKASSRLLARLTRDPSAYVCYAVASAEALPKEAREVIELHPSYVAPSKGLRMDFGLWLRSPPHGRTRYLPLDATSAEAIRARVLSHPAAPVSLLAPFVEMQYGMGGYEIAHHPWLLVEPTLADALLVHPYDYTRRNMAERGDLPPAMVERLANDPSVDVRACVAARPDLSIELWQTFATAKERELREGAARSPMAPDLAKLALDAEVSVRRAVANNPTMPRAIANALAADPDATVRQAAVTSPSLDP
jgi:hypothetical protein